MNLLKNETSPYLLQHANNPVHWMPWGVAAFNKAEEENKPLLVSIGYSSCHWCHVMEHESFEDEETAALMNALFINIKVDREEFPDVDHMYMDAVQAMTGSGGWPLNVFLTPDKKPFYGGTYFPPVRTHGRASWKEVLINVSQYFSQNRTDVEAQAEKLLGHLKQSSLVGVENANFHKEKEENENLNVEETVSICKDIKEKLIANADKEEGGFGMAPKFPSTFSLKYLLDHYSLYGDKEALQHALLSLDKMMMGGIYDQIGGGFARYSTDKYWIAPHFEKMLYDNALLIEVYAIAYSITKDEKYKEVIDEIITWLTREMTSEEAGFYAAQDADSEGVEGKYYTWSYEELNELLQGDFKDFAAYYHIEEHGNWEHTNILYSTYESNAMISNDFKKKLKTIHQTLIEIRNERIKPLTDDKILLGWNALMNKALVTAYLFTSNEPYLQLAEKNMKFILHKFSSKEHLFFHTYKNDIAKIPAYLDDLAYLADALISLANATADTSYLYKANEIVEFITMHFSNAEDALFNFTHRAYLQVTVNKKEIYDGAIPSPNAVLCRVLYLLYHAFWHDIWKDRSKQMLSFIAAFSQKYPSSFAVWCAEFQRQQSNTKEITIVGEHAKNIYLELNTKKYSSNVTYITSHKEDTLGSVKGKYQEGETLIYICKDFSCSAPLRDVNKAFIEI